MEGIIRMFKLQHGLFFAVLTASSVLFGCPAKYPKCAQDNDCHEGEFCVNEMCQQCRDNSDCSGGQQCNGGRCDAIEGYCVGAADCGPNQTCESNRCVNRPTESNNNGNVDNNAGNGACQLEAAYFDYDSSTLSPAARDALQRNANCIRSRNLTRVTVSGSTDPRGTEEYNLALGDRRARATIQYMTSLGVPDSVMTAGSVGEEMAQGEDESGWARDRRADFRE